jgi:tRNA pseudouridine13 synthase
MIPAAWRGPALAPPRALGPPLAEGILRASPEDFEVRERLGFEPSGEGPHALLCVRKRGANTEWVARELARAAGCKPFEVGFAGLKDRHAVTTQYFTVPRGRSPAAGFAGLRGEGYEVLSSAAHQRKLPRGALEGNDFTITVREFRCDPSAVAARLRLLGAGGAPNYFGPQRFGREAGNLAAVILAAEGGGAMRGEQRGFTLSTARSLIFNAILAGRVERGTWNTLSAGDVANLDGRGSVFAVEQADETLAVRCASLEIHPTAPLPGAGEPLSSGEVRADEEAVAARFPEALAVIREGRMNSERRATRIRIRGLEHEYDAERAVLRLRFGLGAGSFATTVLREIIANVDGE